MAVHRQMQCLEELRHCKLVSVRSAPTHAGMVHNTTRISRQQAAALGMLSSEEGLAAMHSLLWAQHAQRAAVVGAVRPAYWLGLLAKVQQLPHLYSELGIRPAQDAPDGGDAAVASQPSQPAAAAQPAAWSAAGVEAAVNQLVAAVLGVEGADPDTPLAAQGLDSLAGLELRQKVQVRFKADSVPCQSAPVDVWLAITSGQARPLSSLACFVGELGSAL